MKLFFKTCDDIKDFLETNQKFDENPLLCETETFSSIEALLAELKAKRKAEKLTRGSIYGFIRKLANISALTLFPNPKDGKEKSIRISFLGIAFFLQKLFQQIDKE